MRIRVFPRSFFEARIGGDDAGILERFTVISINTPCLQEKPPFSADLLIHPNLKVIYFDDVENPADPEQRNFQFMTSDDAKAIIDFMRNSDLRRPLLIHCTAGISRSGAVGDILNWYYNRLLEDNQADFNYFVSTNLQIVPNQWVRKQLLRQLMPVGELLL